MIINVLISTIDNGINKVGLVIQNKMPDIKYIISHQYTDEKFLKVPDALRREDVQISQIPGKGLSKSRNNALMIADGDIALIADDDITYLPDTFRIIKKLYSDDSSLNVACFKIKTKDGEPEYKNYSTEAYTFKKKKRHYVSSIEVSFRIQAIKEKGIYFDERFGLGAEKYKRGEEEMFIIDCQKAGLCIQYFPFYIVSHPYESSTKNINEFDKSKIAIQGAIDAKKFGLVAILKVFVSTIFLIRKLLTNGINPINYLNNRLSGVFFFLYSK